MELNTMPSSSKQYEVPENYQSDAVQGGSVLDDLKDEGGVFEVKKTSTDDVFEEEELLENGGDTPFDDDGDIILKQAKRSASSIAQSSVRKSDPHPPDYIPKLEGMIETICKEEGIEFKQEYLDVLIQRSYSGNHVLNKMDGSMFLLGINTERKYSIFTGITDMANKLEAGLKMISNLEIKMRQEREKDKGEVITEVNKVMAEVLSLKEKPSKKEVTFSKNTLYDEADWITPKLQKKIIALDGGKKLSLDDIDSIDISSLGKPVVGSTFYADIASSLGWPRSVGENPKFPIVFKQLDLKIRYLLSYNLLNEEGKEKVRETITTISKAMK